VWASFGRYAAGYLSYWLGDSEVAYKQLSAAADTLSDDDGSYKARALIFLGGIADDLDRGAEAVSYVRRAIDSAAAWGVDLQVSAAMGMGCVLAERVDPAAAEFAAEAIEMCRSNGSAEQLAAAMPTAAMVCWQVGAIDAARAFVDEARPMHAGGRRIARVVLLSTAAGVALDDGDVAAAIDYGRSADAEATELGIEREVPLIRTVLARSLLAAGDVTAAAERAVAGLEAARALSYDHPLASSLETAALVVLAEGTAALQDVAVVMAAAADLRRKGSRPVTPTLRAAVEAAGVRLDVAGIDLSDVPVDRGAAVDLGLALLRAVVGRSA
jgi:hypothetical protein